jgi:hypothetical protein
LLTNPSSIMSTTGVGSVRAVGQAHTILRKPQGTKYKMMGKKNNVV